MFFFKCFLLEILSETGLYRRGGAQTGVNGARGTPTRARTHVQEARGGEVGIQEIQIASNKPGKVLLWDFKNARRRTNSVRAAGGCLVEIITPSALLPGILSSVRPVEFFLSHLHEDSDRRERRRKDRRRGQAKNPRK